MFRAIISAVQRFPALIIIAVIALTGVAGWYGAGVGEHMQAGGFLTTNAESTKVNEAIRKDFGKHDTGVVILVETKDGQKVTDPAIQQEVAKQADTLSTRKGVREVQSYYSTGSDELVSKDQTKTLLLVTMTGNEDEQAKDVGAFRHETKSDVVSMRFGGAAALNNEITEQVSQDLVKAETISFIILAVLLVLVFRGFVAAALPLLLGGFTIIGAFAVLRFLTGFTPIVEYAQNVIVLLGLGLAVDYSLLIVSRFREELYNYKNDTKAALTQTYRTAGRTVLFSGLTVIISLASLIVFPLDFLRSMGIGGIAAVFIALFAATVVLPAILRLLGSHVNWLSFGTAKKLDQAAAHGDKVKMHESIWYKTGALFMKHRIITLILTLGFLVAASLPVFHAKLASPDGNAMPASAQGRQVSNVIEDEFGIKNQEITVLYKADSLTTPEQIGKLYDYVEDLKAKKGVKEVETIVNISPDLTKQEYQMLLSNPEMMPESMRQAMDFYVNKNTTVLTVKHDYTLSSTEAQKLVTDIRGQKAANASVQVGGFTAELVDQLDALAKYTPYAAAIIFVTLFILLFLMIGSVIIPLQAMVLNLLSFGAAFGGMTLIFGDGFLADWLQLTSNGIIYATIPPMIFAVAFGLSMDYSVFLYGRIKEEYDRTQDNEKAVLAGLQKTGNIITAAALLLFVVVIAFASSGIAVMQQIGVGLALAIIIDAFIVRMVLVPATMRLFGKANWWAPKALKKLHAKLGWSERS